jgi:predicted nucleotidyltransferase
MGDRIEQFDLPADVAAGLLSFVDAARAALGDDLVSIVLFGSAAEGRLRATSDVNLIIVLARFERAGIDALREPLRLAHATVRLQAMLILESELADAAEDFAVKFADIHRRHRVLAGRDVIAALAPSPAATRARLKQILLNFVLRTRERYALVSLREEQMAGLVADAAGPLRSAAAAILELEGRPAASAKAALEMLAGELHPEAWRATLASLSAARESGSLPPGAGAPAVLSLIELAKALHLRADRIVPR